MKSPIRNAVARAPMGTRMKRAVTGIKMRNKRMSLGMRTTINFGLEGHLILNLFINFLI